MKIAVRLDDIAPVMRWDNFDRMIDLLKAHGALPILGVIPDCRDEKILSMPDVSEKEADEFLKEINALREEGAVVAMHGVHHVYTTEKGGCFPLNEQSEFAGLSLEEQEALLKEGVQIFKEKGLETDLFMAPSHSYDENTLKALAATGFKRVTDGFGTAPYRYQELTFYPIAVRKSSAVRSKRRGSVTLVYHTNTMKDSDFAAAEALFADADMICARDLLFEPTDRRSDDLQKLEYAAAWCKRLLMKRKAKKK